MASADSDWEPVPTYSDLLRGIFEFLEKNYRETFITKRGPHPIEANWRYFNFSNRDIFCVLLLSIALTILRHLATEWIFKPIAHHYALTPTNQRKMPESAWKFVFFLSAWSYSCYVIIFSGKYKFFQKPSTVWHNWTLDEPVPGDIYFVYMIQCGFYIHFTYATLFIDTWRKDYFVMIAHHVLTLLLIALSYSLRFFARLYCYPLKVLYSATSDKQRMKIVLPCDLLLNSWLWGLQLLHIYWSLIIVRLWYRVATGQIPELDDTREYDVEEKISREYLSRSSNHNTLQNDLVKTNVSCDENSVLSGDVDGMSNRVKKES